MKSKIFNEKWKGINKRQLRRRNCSALKKLGRKSWRGSKKHKGSMKMKERKRKRRRVAEAVPRERKRNEARNQIR